MSLAVDFLREYFGRPDVTQSEYAKSAGIDPSLLTKLLSQEVLISSKNLPRLLRGFHDAKDRVDFLTAHLRDQVPSDYADAISIHVNKGSKNPFTTEQGDDASMLEGALLMGFTQLPSDNYRRRIVRFIDQLRRDADLRKFFSMTMDFVDDGISANRDSGATGREIYEAHKQAPTSGIKDEKKASSEP